MGNIWKIPQNFLYLHLHFKRKKNWLTYKEKVLCETNIMMRHSEPGSCVVIIIEIIYSQECFNRFYYLLSAQCLSLTEFQGTYSQLQFSTFPTSIQLDSQKCLFTCPSVCSKFLAKLLKHEPFKLSCFKTKNILNQPTHFLPCLQIGHRPKNDQKWVFLKICCTMYLWKAHRKNISKVKKFFNLPHPLPAPNKNCSRAPLQFLVTSNVL